MRRPTLMEEIQGKDASYIQQRVNQIWTSLPSQDRDQVMMEYQQKVNQTGDRWTYLASLLDKVFARYAAAGIQVNWRCTYVNKTLMLMTAARWCTVKPAIISWYTGSKTHFHEQSIIQFVKTLWNHLCAHSFEWFREYGASSAVVCFHKNFGQGNVWQSETGRTLWD